MALHAYEGKAPFSDKTLGKIVALRQVYGLDLTAEDSHQLRENAKWSLKHALKEPTLPPWPTR